VTEEWAEAYAYDPKQLRPITVRGSQLQTLNGHHALFGWWEDLTQSSRCPSFLWEDYGTDFIFEVIHA
jgi:hypothetical protein